METSAWIIIILTIVYCLLEICDMFSDFFRNHMNKTVYRLIFGNYKETIEIKKMSQKFHIVNDGVNLDKMTTEEKYTYLISKWDEIGMLRDLSEEEKQPISEAFTELTIALLSDKYKDKCIEDADVILYPVTRFIMQRSKISNEPKEYLEHINICELIEMFNRCYPLCLSYTKEIAGKRNVDIEAEAMVHFCDLYIQFVKGKNVTKTS